MFIEHRFSINFVFFFFLFHCVLSMVFCCSVYYLFLNIGYLYSLITTTVCFFRSLPNRNVSFMIFIGSKHKYIHTYGCNMWCFFFLFSFYEFCRHRFSQFNGIWMRDVEKTHTTFDEWLMKVSTNRNPFQSFHSKCWFQYISSIPLFFFRWPFAAASHSQNLLKSKTIKS